MLILITGGVGNDKSLMAETIVTHCASGKLFYIATMHQPDDESKKRVVRHKEMRAEKGFETYEKYVDISSLCIDENSAYLLECIPNLLANEMFDDDGAKGKAVDKILSDIDKIKSSCQCFVIVTNEVALDGNVYDEFSTQYIENIVRINCKIAQQADRVIECVAGIPIYLKGEKYELI